MHRRVNRPERPHVNHLEPQRVNQAEHQPVNHLEYRQMNHLLYASKTHHRIPASLLRLHVSQTIIINDPNLVQTEHPDIVVVLVEAVPEEAVVLVGVVLEEAVGVEDGNNRFIYLKLHSTT
jgi:hypothetical protein